MRHVLVDKLNQAWSWRAWRDTTVIVAVSGGADSVALLRALHQIAGEAAGTGQLIVAHFNHRLRGDESDQDEAFVADLCQTLGLSFRSNAADDGAPSSGAAFSVLPADTDASSDGAQNNLDRSDGKGGDVWDSENETRTARYRFLRHVAAQSGARYLATAHSADDQVETVLHRIFRGTGITGLAGIPRTRVFMPGVSLIRPLLDVWRTEVLDFLNQLQQPYRTDSSNVSRRFTRNRLRYDLLPVVERDFNPRGKEALFRLASIAQELSDFVHGRVAELLRVTLTGQSTHAVELDCRSLGEVEPFLVRQLFVVIWQQQNWPLREMTQEKWNGVVSMVDPSMAEKKVILPGNIMVHRREGKLSLSKNS